MSAVDLTQDALPVEEPEPEEEELHFLMRLDASTHNYVKFVGIQHYRGVAHPGEYVTLVREPENPYDRNAIRCDNIAGIKVGHVKRELAAILSPLMARKGDRLQVDAIIPGPGSKWDFPLSISLYGEDPNDATSIEARFRDIRRGGYRPQQQAKPPPPTVHKRTLDWKDEQKRLDDLFTKQLEQQLSNLPELTLPTVLRTSLLPYQVTGIRWLVSRERNTATPFYQTLQEQGKTVHFCKITKASSAQAPEPVKGAILADDMGLGKTIQTIGLILSNPPAGRDYSKPLVIKAAPEQGSVGDADVPLKKPSKTVVKKLKINVLKDLVTHIGKSDALALSKKDALVNSVLGALDSGDLSIEDYYQVVAASEAEQTRGGRQEVRPTTLIVAPVSVMGNWQEQIAEHVAPDTLRVALYHGPDRKELVDCLDSIDVLICSYQTLQTDYSKVSTTDENGGPALKKLKTPSLFHHTFHRVVLDEAHTVRNGKSKIFAAVKAIKKVHGLCLTGTPLQNKPEDVQSLLAFLNVPPLADSGVFRRAIAQPIKEGDDTGMALLRNVMAHFALRRSKSGVTIELPPKQVELRVVEYRAECPHKAVYETIYQSAKVALQASMKGGDLQGVTQQSVFEILTRLRQACCSGKLVPSDRLRRAEQVLASIKRKESLTPEEGRELLERLKGALDVIDDAPPECAICMEAMNEHAASVLRKCGHVFCQPCLSKVAHSTNCYGGSANKCPFCRQVFVQEDIVKWIEASAASQSQEEVTVALSEQINQVGPSPKMEALLTSIRHDMKPGEKGVIFSQFTKFLDELQAFLKVHKLTFTRIDGTKSSSQRVQALSEFSRVDGGPDFILCSLHAAGTGINLTRANHVWMMDTWFNQAVELQANDRIHRIGQKLPVHVVRFVTANSVESRMVELQEAKAAMGKGAFETLSPEEKKKTRLQDLQRLLELN